MTSIGSSGGGNYRSVGMDSAAMLERLGMPGSVSSAMGAQIDEAVGDVKGMFQNLNDMFQKGMQEDLGKLFGNALAPNNFVPRPLQQLAEAFERGLGGFSKAGGLHKEAPFGKGSFGKSMEAAINSNPMFKAQMERALGGVIIPDGKMDGKLSVYRPPSPMIGDALKHAFKDGLLAGTGLAGALANMGLPMGAGGPLQSTLARLVGNIASFAAGGPNGVGGGGGAQAAGGTGAAGGTEGTEATGKGGWAEQVGPEGEEFAKGMGIDLKNASFEDVLFLLLMKYAKKKEDDIMKKVQELDKSMQSKEGGGEGGDKAGGAGSGGGGGGSGGGGGGSVGGGGGSVGGGGGSLGAVGGSLGAAGGSLGAAAGAVGNIAKMVGGAGGAGGAEGAGGGGGPGGASGSSGGGGGMQGGDLGGKMDPSKMSDTMKQQMLQKLMGDLQKLYEMLSNMIKTMHDMQMTPVRNLRS